MDNTPASAAPNPSAQLPNELISLSSQEAPKTTAQKKPPPPKAAIISLLILFPPAALYLIWKNPRYYHWLYYTLWIFGALSVIWLLYNKFVLLEQVSEVYRSLGLPPPIFSELILYIGIIFYVFSIGYGFYLKKRLQDVNLDSKKHAFTAIMLITVGIVLSFVVQIMSILVPVYALLEQFPGAIY